MGFSFEMGDEELGLMTTGRFWVKMRVPSLALASNRPLQTCILLLYSMLHGDLCYNVRLSWQIILVLQNRLVKMRT